MTAPGAGRRPMVKAVIVLLCAVLGFAFAVQARRTNSADSLRSARPDDLVQILDGLQRREDELTAQIADLQDSLNRLRRTGAGGAEALAEANRRAQALGVLAGTLPAAGPGVRLSITDPDHRITAEVLLAALEELRNAGDEAYQFGSVRIGVDSAFTGPAGAIVLDGTGLTAPYTVLAIGDPPTLAAALAIPGGVTDTVRRAGGVMTVTQSEQIGIDALRPPWTPQYARPTGG